MRKYADEAAVAETAQAAGVTDIWQRKLKKITTLEKQLGKQRFNQLLGDLVVKPVGKPTLVPESNKRPALVIQSATDEFTAIK
ncbi:DUF2800 domain-containing protein [Corynebacterium amycolatum]|uniref:DUF2800 domain-containing protein n=1 Tax=Corynebacterium amycolatum TaxID=43765 RepID=UPI0021D0E53A